MRRFGLLIIVALAAGCAGTQVPASNTKNSADLRRAEDDADSGRYQSAIQTYEKAAAEPRTETAGEALYQAAYLEAFYDNPQRDYAQALQGFDDYIKRYPRGAHLKDAKNWRSILKTVLDLRVENNRLGRKIDELKQIDILHEEKRAH